MALGRHAVTLGPQPLTALGLVAASVVFNFAVGNSAYFQALRRLGVARAMPLTLVQPLRLLAGATLVECRLETGRQHQIRIHLSELGHPLVGERVYIRDFRGSVIEAARPMLHACALGFVHPRTGERMAFEREAPADFRATIEALSPVPRRS